MPERDVVGKGLGELGLEVSDVGLLTGDKVVELVYFLVDDFEVRLLEGGSALSLFLLLLLDADDLREDQLAVDERRASQACGLLRRRVRLLQFLGLRSLRVSVR